MTIRARAGELRHRITIEQPVRTNDAGSVTETWDAVATVWARKRDLSGRELMAAQQAQSEVSTEFTIRRRTDVDATMRVNHGGTLYRIEAITEDDKAAVWQTLRCARGLSDGS